MCNENEDLRRIQQMSQYELVKLWRFGGSDHPFISNPILFEAVRKQLFEFYDGITPAISKQVGWEE